LEGGLLVAGQEAVEQLAVAEGAVAPERAAQVVEQVVHLADGHAAGSEGGYRFGPSIYWRPPRRRVHLFLALFSPGGTIGGGGGPAEGPPRLAPPGEGPPRTEHTRREFLQAGLAGAAALGLAGAAHAADDKADGLPTRPLGKTGQKVSIICLGGWHIGSVK